MDRALWIGSKRPRTRPLPSGSGATPAWVALRVEGSSTVAVGTDTSGRARALLPLELSPGACGSRGVTWVRGYLGVTFGLEGIATWLILPVVICLSQRLSHACASMNQFEL